MATGDDIVTSRSAKMSKIGENSEKICNYCNKKVIDYVKCIKCTEFFHPSCLARAAKMESTNCQHEVSYSNRNHENEDFPDLKSENKFLKMQVEYLNAIIVEIQSKNSILLENNKLLVEKIANQELTIRRDKTAKNQNTMKDNSNIEHASNFSKQQPTYCSVAGSSNQLNINRNSNLGVSNSSTKVNKDNLSKSRSSEIVGENEEKWTTVLHNKKKPGNISNKNPDIICKGKQSTSGIIKGATRRKWIYVGKIAGKEVSEEDIINYMGKIDEHENILVKKLDTKGQNSAFSIGLPSEASLKKICDESFWPDGVILRNFTFRNFFRTTKSTTAG